MELEKIKKKLNTELLELLTEQGRQESAIELIAEAFAFAHEKHIEQKRKSGEPYIIHPVAVAKTLIELNCDEHTVCAGILHDVLEDTDTSPEEMQEKFGEVILELVQGVTKLGKLNFKSTEEHQASNFRKMLIAMAKDVRVVLVKLADRLNNMQTLDYLSEEKQQRISKETIDIFAPLANRFGLHAIKVELEDLCLKYLHPNGFRKIKNLVASKKGERETQIKTVQDKIIELLALDGIEADTKGRAKHFFSIFRKVKDPITGKVPENIDDLQVYDLLGIRIIVGSIKDCYAALGVVHEAFRPMPGRFKDYIAVPKANLYQSLHTTVLSPFGKPVEVQIRTHEMHEIAENGIAAHWNYKESGQSSNAQEQDVEELRWIRQLITWHTDVEDAQEYLDTVKKDILSQEIYVLTPNGDVITLPDDSTPIDFAYKIHSKVGDTCTGAKVNDKIVTINHKLQNGDLVEIITNKNSHPNLSWLNFVKTNQAKHRIKSWYKSQNKDRHLILGKEILEEKFGKKEGFEQFMRSAELEAVAQKLNYKTTEDLVASVGSGDTTVSSVFGKLQDTKYALDDGKAKQEFGSIKARKAPAQGEEADIPELDGLLYNIGKCCMPIPGEPVIGAISKGRGITIHRSSCHNLTQIEQERLMRINWHPKGEKSFPAHLLIEVVDRVGIVKDILTLVADAGMNISDFKVKERPEANMAILRIILNVRSQEQLKKTVYSIKNMTDVLSVERV